MYECIYAKQFWPHCKRNCVIAIYIMHLYVYESVIKENEFLKYREKEKKIKNKTQKYITFI